MEAFMDELSGYETTKGSVKFPNSRPLPLDLITRIVQFRVAQNLDKATAKTYKQEG
jgi:uncharacterized protein YdhG (YjbR/CyaY superfamily)